MRGNIIFTLLISPPQIVQSYKMEKMIKGAQSLFLHYYSMEGTSNERQNTDPHDLE